MKRLLYLLFLSAICPSQPVFGDCEISSPAPCYVDECESCYCLGPSNIISNAPLFPKTCDGDIVLKASVLYWNAQLDGIDYAIKNEIAVPIILPTTEEIEELNHLKEARYLHPPSTWNFGYQLALGYHFPCDGWEALIEWTNYHTGSFCIVDTEFHDPHTYLPMWSGFAPAQGSVLYNKGIEVFWKLRLDLIDLKLSREYWISRRVTFRPLIGLRFAQIRQKIEIEQRGGSWSPRINPTQRPFNNYIDLGNHYKGVGPMGGLATSWNVGCGFSLIGQMNGSIIYGRFNVSNEEENQLIISPYSKTEIVDVRQRFRSSKPIFDTAIGIEYSALYRDGLYAVTGRLVWEHHLFFHQNQLFRIQRAGDTPTFLPNDTGENLYYQRRGDLSTQGFSFSIQIDV